MGKNRVLGWEKVRIWVKNPETATLQYTFRTDRENARSLPRYNVKKNVQIFCAQQRRSGPEQQRSPLHQIHSSTLSESIQASTDFLPVLVFPIF
jgi:hypothetical protein